MKNVRLLSSVSRFFIAVAVSLFSSYTLAASWACHVPMVFDNQTQLSGFFFGNDQDSYGLGSLQVNTGPQAKMFKTWDNSHCENSLGDSSLWKNYHRTMSEMAFYDKGPIQKRISCSPVNLSLKEGNAVIYVSLTRNGSDSYRCNITMQ